MFEQWGVELISSLLLSWLGPLTVILLITFICIGFIVSYRFHCYVLHIDQQKWYHRVTKWFTYYLLWVFEILCNYTVLIAIFRQLPHHKRGSKTVHDKAHENSIIARWICHRLLNPNDNGLIYPADEYKIQ